MVAPRLGTRRRGLPPPHPGCTRPPAPPPLPGSLSLQTARRNGETRSSGHPSSGTGPQPGSGSHIKGSVPKGSSHLWAALAAGSRTRDRTSGSWQRVVLGRPGPPRCAERESTADPLGARSTPFSGAHAPPRVRPVRSVSGPRSRSRALGTRPALRQVPAFAFRPHVTFPGADVSCRGEPPTPPPETPGWSLRLIIRGGPSCLLPFNGLPPPVAWRCCPGGGGAGGGGAETGQEPVLRPGGRRSADLSPGARAPVRSASGSGSRPDSAT